MSIDVTPVPYESAYTFPVIGVMRSCYSAKFGIPRQPGLISEATGYIELLPPYNQPNCVRGLEGFSHIWVLFVFHENIREKWKATVRPPRLGGDKRVGVFATRSPFRPSPIGLSVIELTDIQIKPHGIIRLYVRGQDLVNNTPIVDIKPYIPFTDSVPEATRGFAQEEPDVHSLNVTVTDEAKRQFEQLAEITGKNYQELAVKMVSSDPRPAYQKIPGRVYGVFIEGHEAVWQIQNDGNAVITHVNFKQS